MNEMMTPEAEKVLDTIAKLLALADRAGTPEEAAVAASKAQDLMLKHGLSTATLEKRSGSSGKRMQDAVEGGFYRYQRDVWAQVARLNFCLHWVTKKRVEVKNIRRKNRWEDIEYSNSKPTYKFDGTVRRRFHMLVGRQANVKTTVAVANYLLAAVERLTREVCEEKKLDVMSRWAMSFREGCAYNITNRLWKKRQAMIDEEEQKEREAWERAAKAGTSLGTALTITTLARQEEEENFDFLEGKAAGTNARERAEAAAERKREEDEYTRWAAANPEEARAKREAEEAEEKARREKAKKRASRSSGNDRYANIDHQAFWEGDKRAKKIGLDQQADHETKNARRIGR